MTTARKIQKKIKQTKDLSSIVKTMKSIAAVNIRHYENSARTVNEYYRTIEMGFQILLQNKPELLSFYEEKLKKKKQGKSGFIVIGSERGMCGEFNDRLHRYLLQSTKDIARGDIYLLAVGEQISYRLETLDHVQTLPFPFSFEGVGELLLDLLFVVDEWRENEGIEDIVLYFNRLSSASTYQPSQVSILPLSLDWLSSLQSKRWDSRSLPTYSLTWEELFASLVHEYIYISLYLGFAESLASENLSRLTSMEAAEKNIDEHLKELNKRFHHHRQTSITDELFDIISGFEAIQ